MAQVTDRAAIADELLGGLAELDKLKSVVVDKQSAVQLAQQQADEANAEYATKIDEMLDSGWATPQALAAQGHSAPRRRGGPRRKAAPETTSTPEPSEG